MTESRPWLEIARQMGQRLIFLGLSRMLSPARLKTDRIEIMGATSGDVIRMLEGLKEFEERPRLTESGPNGLTE